MALSTSYRPFLVIGNGRFAINPALISDLDLSQVDRGIVVVKMSSGTEYTVSGEALETLQEMITLL